MAQDSGGPEAAGKWFDRASPTYRCVVDPTHQISSLFGWVAVPSAAWIDEDGRIVRSNEGVYPAETTIRFGVGKVRVGDNAFAQATRDWIERGADSEHVWSSKELAERLKPVDDDTFGRSDVQAGVVLPVGVQRRAWRFTAGSTWRPSLELPASGLQGDGLCLSAGSEANERPPQELRQELLRPHGVARREPSPVYRARVAVDACRSAAQATAPPLEGRGTNREV